MVSIPTTDFQEWAAQWLCVSCNRTADSSHIPRSSPRAVVLVFEVSVSNGGCARSHSTGRTWRVNSFTSQFQALVGTQSWLLCPFISLALAGAERARNVTLVLHWTSSACSLPQERFWLSQSIIDALTAHSQSLSPQSPVALELQSPDAWTWSDHLPAGLQERCVPSSHHGSSARVVDCTV